MRSRQSEAGFSLLEVMACVVVIGILAVVVVPSFAGESRKSRAKSETAAVMAELASKQAKYKFDKGAYLTAAACPAAPSSTGQVATSCTSSGQPWSTLGVSLPERKLYCSYAITTGTSKQNPSPPSPFTMPAQAASWYYIVATCDMDGKAGYSTYFTSSWDATIQVSAEGA